MKKVFKVKILNRSFQFVEYLAGEFKNDYDAELHLLNTLPLYPNGYYGVVEPMYTL